MVIQKDSIGVKIKIILQNITSTGIAAFILYWVSVYVTGLLMIDIDPLDELFLLFVVAGGLVSGILSGVRIHDSLLGKIIYGFMTIIFGLILLVGIIGVPLVFIFFTNL